MLLFWLRSRERRLRRSPALASHQLRRLSLTRKIAENLEPGNLQTSNVHYNLEGANSSPKIRTYSGNVSQNVIGLGRLEPIKDVRAHCYCASLVRTLFIGHARATSFSSARTESKTQQNIELMTFALTWCANIFVRRSVTPTFFSADRFLF